MADRAVDGYCDMWPYTISFTEPIFDAGVAFIKLVNNLTNCVAAQLYCLNAAGQVPVDGWDPDIVLHWFVCHE